MATGYYYLPADAKGDWIANSIKNESIFDEYIYDIAKEHIKPHSIVLDIGSNFGQLAILMSRHVGDGWVYAFDAEPFVYSILEKNIEINNAKVKPYFGAVHHTGGETLYFPEPDFVRFPTYGSYGIDYVNHEGRAVPTIAVDDLEFPLPVSFMKVDVQGGDLFAMQGSVKTINKFKMPIVFEYEKEFEQEQGYSFKEYEKFIEKIGYKIVYEVKSNYLIVPK